MVFGMEVGLSPSDLVVLDGDPSLLPPKGGRAPSPISAHFYCDQSAGCTEMPLGMELGLSPGDFVRWGHSPLPKKGAKPPNFRPMLIEAKRLDRSGWHLARR